MTAIQKLEAAFGRLPRRQQDVRRREFDAATTLALMMKDHHQRWQKFLEDGNETAWNAWQITLGTAILEHGAAAQRWTDYCNNCEAPALEKPCLRCKGCDHVEEIGMLLGHPERPRADDAFRAGMNRHAKWLAKTQGATHVTP